METHSSVLAWRIPGTREPGGLPSMGSHRVGQDWSDLAAAATLCIRASLVAQLVKNIPANEGKARYSGSIPGSRRSPGGGNGIPLQYSCLENPMDREAWRATVHGVTKSQTWLNVHAHMHALSISHWSIMEWKNRCHSFPYRAFVMWFSPL